MTSPDWTRVGAALMALGVITAAWGAHGLDKVVTDPHLRDVWATGVRLHLYHGLGLLIVGRLHGAPRAAGWLLLLGVILFSGSLYVMALTGIRWLGAITPLGGLSFIIGWTLVAWKARPSSASGLG